ncbi:hypothetical protein BBJ29_008534 [Phytophthora kernoviae]|uniref:Ankyrin repeat domain-containing protein n=1 Tax=Phytophthora kernoviae TaxID=325452 RepID=A0A3F2RSY2_9STRA|nr:hypothetical protein BBJ29_008534 [Phytophthora kernoviae]RLN62784.1 hypothetical protein BBP00_00004550 [Phytophthora kernoviae]
MQNFSMDAQFRPVVNPDRKLKQLPTDKDTPFDEVQQFVDHLQLSTSKGKDKKAGKLKHKHSSSSLGGYNNPSDGKTSRALRLEKGRKVEMHMDVVAGDTIRWEFLSKSSDFCFVATYYHEDQHNIVCRTDGVKNMAIVGAFEVEHNGSFVLRWMNTQKGFTIDRSGIKISSMADLGFGMKNTFRNLTLLPPTRRVRKDFEATVVMTESFPLQLRDFLPVIKFISTTGEHVKNLEEFFQMTLPPGFPVKFELPMMFTIRVAYTFQKITLHPQLDQALFEIPSDYHEVFTLDEVRS